MASTRHLVDPELLQLLDEFPTIRLSREGLGDVRAARAAQLVLQLASEPAFPDINVSERFVPHTTAGQPDVRVLVYLPKNASQPLPVLLWIHGGGYVLGTADADGLQMKTLVSQVGCAVVSVDYRLAPEAPFPAGVEDCYAALRWTHANAAELGIDRDRIAIGGASAGGGLAAALALLARDRAEVPVALQLLLVPMLDDRTAAQEEHHPFAGEFVWTPHNNHFGWSSLLGHEPGRDGVSPYASPARAESVAGLPPAYISTGSLDLFLEEDMEYARRLARVGIPTELHVYPGAFHGFSRAVNARVSKAYTRDYMHALQRAFEAAPARTPVAAT
jgi:acetyl esterase/lipase